MVDMYDDIEGCINYWKDNRIEFIPVCDEAFDFAQLSRNEVSGYEIFQEEKFFEYYDRVAKGICNILPSQIYHCLEGRYIREELVVFLGEIPWKLLENGRPTIGISYCVRVFGKGGTEAPPAVSYIGARSRFLRHLAGHPEYFEAE